VKVAHDMGFRTHAAPGMSDARQKNTAPPRPVVLLENSAGQRIAIEMRPSGKMCIRGNGGDAMLREIISRHTQDRVSQHLAERGMQVEVKCKKNGEIELTGRASGSTGAAPMATVRADITPGGAVHLDVENASNECCQNAAAECARAIGGVVVKSADKTRRRQNMPGEPARVRQRG
jgi:hypothetical protein